MSERPESNRIYYTDPSCRTFDATVTRAWLHEGRPAVTLDRTAFYPTSGGQPFDTGRLGSVDVVDVIDAEGEVVHLLAAPLPGASAVHGEIDWTRRFDHMQQHTGQHVLSAACERLFENRTLSFHMGAETSSIDLAREAPAADVERAVDEANAVVWSNRPVSIRFVSAEEAASLPLRKEPTREGPLRLIEIEDFDLSACGGTHVASTGAIGIIAVLASERFRGGTRLTFVCGARALRAVRVYRDAVAGSVRALSVLPDELPAAVERLQADAKGLRKNMARQQEALAGHEATRLLSATPATSGVRTIVDVLEGWDAGGLKNVAASIAASGNAAVALFSSAPPIAAVVARSNGVPVDAAGVLEQLLQRFGGRGGGKPDMAQGGGLTGDVRAIASVAGELLRRA